MRVNTEENTNSVVKVAERNHLFSEGQQGTISSGRLIVRLHCIGKALD
jgi:hypothetical protein